MEMKRTIHAIGQGAFYTEKFYTDSNESYTIVYDCGSSTGRSIIENEIVNTFDKEKNITAIFISHFHQDHINGIDKLLKHCNVKYVFLPVLTNESKLLLKAYENNREILDFIDNPGGYIRDRSENTTVVWVDEANNNPNNEQQNQEGFRLNGEQSRTVESTNIESGTTISLADPKSSNIVWEYIPYNLRHDDLYDKIKSCLRPGIDLKNISPDDLKEIKKSFDKVIKKDDKNINSMVLYSGLSDLHKWSCKKNINCNYGFGLKKCYCYYFESSYCKNYNTGCLYLGDYNLKKNNAFERLMEKYNRVANNISIVQVPHHGSELSFNDLIFTKFADHKMFFISYGKYNRYKHPSDTVIEKITDSHNCVCLVTEEERSAIEFIYVLR